MTFTIVRQRFYETRFSCSRGSMQQNSKSIWDSLVLIPFFVVHKKVYSVFHFVERIAVNILHTPRRMKRGH
ncbi:hypothetical protein PBCV1_a045R [Paramecium bursaria Chlorella virus 1]|uniref:Uncharacterized protein n=1 Tax=Paramecium bursaria Chlorella virus 1 TaxID=10506 RepID=Q89380_PBCV1|nr:hypothetical protein PBCV1_a045R [Paramecium bursaria Chlorella virus 1]AAC96413.1 hypothetical protein [Paramecium bursaria Chlorella virus 1]